MEIAHKQLQQIIKEEIEGLLFEQRNFDGMTGFPITQDGAKMIQKNPDREVYKKYKKAIDSIAAGAQSPEKIKKIVQAVRKKEGHQPAEEPVDEPKKADVEDDLYRQRDDDDLRADPEPPKPEEVKSAAKILASVTKQLMSVVPMLPPEIEPKAEPHFAKVIEFLTNVTMYLQKNKK